jgi:NAD(P)-dependent dehydrogenase (short-subunit alcohol dehydrogenase family)
MGHPPNDPRVIVIAGATGALGRAATAAFAADGHKLGLVGRDGARLSALAAELGLSGDQWAPAAADLRDDAAAAAAVEAIAGRFGRVDVVLHLVGGWAGGTALVDVDADTVTSMLGQHVWSTFNLARAAVPGMVEHRWGRIIAVTSVATVNPGPRVAAYLAAKAAQEAMLRVLAREVADQGVTVNLIAVKAIDADHERERDPSKKNAGWTSPEEIVAMMRFLVADEGGSINGARIPLDGRG